MWPGLRQVKRSTHAWDASTSFLLEKCHEECGQRPIQDEEGCGWLRLSRSRTGIACLRPVFQALPAFHDELVGNSPNLEQLAWPWPTCTIPYSSTVKGDSAQSIIQERAWGCISKQHEQQNHDGSQVDHTGDFWWHHGSHDTKIVQWCNKEISITLLTNPSPCFIRVILWKIYKISWCYELCAFDQPLNPWLWAEHCMECVSFMHAIFPGSSGLLLWSEALLSKPGNLGLTHLFLNNVHALHSFCLLLSMWPSIHLSFLFIPTFSKQPKQAEAY